MTELGNRLKEARKAKGISLEDLQNITKIQKRYLKGIEEGNYDSMPGAFYVRAFIKQYAEAVGIDANELLEEYKTEVPNAAVEEIPEQMKQISRAQPYHHRSAAPRSTQRSVHKSVAPNTTKVMNILPKVIIVAIIVLVLFLIWFAIATLAGKHNTDKLNSQQSDNVNIQESPKVKSNNAVQDKNKAKKEKNSQTSTATKKKQKDTNKTDNTKQSLKVVSTSGYNSTYKLTNTDQFKVKLIAKGGQTWIQVKNSDGSSQFQGLLKDGDSKTFDLTTQNEAVFVIGNTVNTKMYVNNKKLSYTISPSSEVRQNVTIQFKPSK
ncbi:helix-turn-helix domain-containing protein [Bacillus ginsengihumi]|uniref:Helix-turn-helix domain-containing protein n=1 Tax=Heyndrickxia ginsengihumi TaxID=363870 RepID=A0A6M0P9Y5_9BACI|nr:RodZ domain-containing protein [Heyndrickxia ginsengihumi]NEY21207.1 helix-turn-helix domain-containing protein [Heyndrickxia ginsengihumi]